MTDMFVVNLQLQEEGSLLVRSCEVLHRDCRNRVSFTKLRDVFSIFVEPFARELNALIGEFGSSRSVVSKPDFAVELPELKIAGLTFLVSAARDGVRNVILRFRYFIGSFQNAFKIDLGWSNTTLPHKERIAIESLIDIVGPLYGLALLEERRDFDEGERREIEQALGELRNNAHSLQFYSDLLIRYVRDSARNEAAAAAAFPSSPRGHLRLVD